MPQSFPNPSSMSAGKNSDAATLQRLRRLSNLLDSAIPIPGTPYSIGLDPILGLLPAGGDLLGGVISAYIVFAAAQLGLPKETLVRMVLNIVLDTVVGTVPVLGDLFDVVWKANTKNMDLLEGHLKYPQPSKKADRSFIILLLAGAMLFIVVVAVLGLILIGSIVRAITGG
jgi:hypothetical protein